jgi:hemin uptake protein HemP
VKEAFTHSPFDELNTLRQFDAARGADGVYVRHDGTVYRLEVVRRAG